MFQGPAIEYPHITSRIRDQKFNTHISYHVSDLRSTAVQRSKPHRGQTRGCNAPKPVHLLKRQIHT